MTTVHQTTQEEKAYIQFREDYWEGLSEPARTLIGVAQDVASTEHLDNFLLQPEQHDEAMEEMCLAAAGLSDREYELLAKLWRVALAAAASIYPDDFWPFTGYRTDRGDLHYYYRTVSGMIETILEEKIIAELRKKSAELEPEDNEYIPF
jgi:hypothetical protein